RLDKVSGRSGGETAVRVAATSVAYRARRRLMVPISSGFADLASEYRVADDRVDQHERKDDQAAPPEHECKTGLRRSGFVDGNDGGDHVWPEGQRQGSKCRYEDQRHHVEWPMVVVTEDAE